MNQIIISRFRASVLAAYKREMDNRKDMDEIFKKYVFEVHIMYDYYRLNPTRSSPLISFLFSCDRGDTKLHTAIRVYKDDLKEIEQLLLQGADVNIVNDLQQSALHQAVANPYCSLDLLNLLLDKQQNLANFLDGQQRTPLHVAIMYGSDKKIISELLARCVDVNAKDCYMMTPLHFAAQYRRKSLEHLLKHGADVNERNCLHLTPLHIAFISRTNGLNKCFIETLLSHGADVNAMSKQCHSVLHYAVANPLVNIDIIFLLLKYGAVPDCRDLQDFPPLGYCKKPNIAFLLIQYSVFVNMINAANDIVQPNMALNIDFLVERKGDWEKRGDMSSYLLWSQMRDLCFIDIIRMRSDLIAPNCTLFDYVSRNYSKKETNFLSSGELLSVLLKYYYIKYKYCNVILYASIQKRDVLDILISKGLYVNPSCDTPSDFTCCRQSTFERPHKRLKHSVRCTEGLPKSIFLNADCIQHLSHFLSKSQLISLTLAYVDHKVPVKL